MLRRTWPGTSVGVGAGRVKQEAVAAASVIPAPWKWARALLMCLVVLGLAYLVDRIPSHPWPHRGTPVARLIVFGATTVLFLRAVSFDCAFRLSSDGRWRPVALFLLSLILTGGAVWLGPAPLKPTVAVFLSACVEEVVFRRELPAALTPQREHGRVPAGLRSGAVLLAQVTFAACHFAVRGHPAPFGSGLPFVSLFASGGFLAVLFRLGVRVL